LAEVERLRNRNRWLEERQEIMKEVIEISDDEVIVISDDE
jgi:hypothetical protein